MKTILRILSILLLVLGLTQLIKSQETAKVIIKDNKISIYECSLGNTFTISVKKIQSTSKKRFARKIILTNNNGEIYESKFEFTKGKIHEAEIKLKQLNQKPTVETQKWKEDKEADKKMLIWGFGLAGGVILFLFFPRIGKKSSRLPPAVVDELNNMANTINNQNKKLNELNGYISDKVVSEST